MPHPVRQKRRTQPPANGAVSSPIPTTSSNTSPKSSTPFRPVSDAIQLLCSTLSPTHIYILSLDTHPASFKRRIFLVPLLLHISIALALLYRAYTILPFYTAIFLSTCGIHTSATIDAHSTEWRELVNLGIERTFLFFLDFALGKFFGGWVIRFFDWREGSTGPIKWRWETGFRDVEVIVRRSRGWDYRIRQEDKGGGGGKQAKEEVVIGEWMLIERSNEEEEVKEGKEGGAWKRIRKAVDREWLRKTGYLLMDKDWDLDFGAMVSAHRLIDTQKADVQDFKTAILAFSSKDGGWMEDPVWESLQGNKEVRKEEQRDQISRFKRKLVEMGRENLFYKWVEMIQYEGSRPGEFTVERQREMKEKGRQMFEDQGVDFEEFWQEVGDVDRMPGMEVPN